MRQSQVSHVFIFALGVIVLALILIFGYMVVKELREKGEQTELVHFKTKLVNDIKIIKEGDVSIKSYTLPKGYREVCFVDDDPTATNAWWCTEVHKTCTGFSDNEPALHNAILSKVKDNVFLVGESKVDSIFIGKIDLGGGPDLTGNGDENYAVYCFEIKNSKLKIKIQGQGDTVLIQKPE